MKEFRNLIFFLVIILVGLRPFIARMTDKSVYRGPWYTVAVPKGWTTKTETDTVYFTTPDQNVLTGMPEATFSIYSYRSKGALFIENLFPDVLGTLIESQASILKKGEIKVDNQISKWVLYETQYPPLMTLSFFIVDDFNRLTRIQFMTHPNDFTKYRPAFEAFKDSLKFKKIF